MMKGSMKAVVVQAPNHYGIETVPIPETPAGGMLLKVDACGLCGSDLRTLRSEHRKVTLPWIIGHEICAPIVEINSRCQMNWTVGTRLAVGPLAYCGCCDFCFAGAYELCQNYREIAQAWQGGLAEYIAIPEDCLRLGTIHPVAQHADIAATTLAEPLSSCIHAQEKGEIGLGDVVVIIGSGAVGCLHTMLARLRGARKTILVDMVAERLTLAEAFHPDVIINASKTDLVAEVLRLTQGKGAHVVITANPAPIAQVQAVQMTRKGGRILLFGGLPVDQSTPAVDMNLVHYNGLHLIGTTIFAPRHQLLALDLLMDGKINTKDLIKCYPLDDFKTAAQLALDGKVLKEVFIP